MKKLPRDEENDHTRGKRVVAEVTLPAPLIESIMHTSARALYRQRQLSNMGMLLSGAVNNAAHSANCRSVGGEP